MIMLTTIIEQGLIYTPLVLGAYIALGLMNCPDLSLASAFTFGAIMATKSLPFCNQLPSPLAAIAVISVALIGGMIVGVTSSCLTRYGKFPHLLSSIITEGLFHGITQLVLGTSNSSLNGYNNPLQSSLLEGRPELPSFLIIGVVTTTIMYLFLKTPLGISFSIYGQNQRFFKHHHISLSYVFILGITISNGLAGIAGYCFAQSNGFVDYSMGIGIPLFAITALLLGKALQISRSLYSALIGLFLYFILQQLLLQVHFNLNYFTCMQSCLLLLIVLTTSSGKNIFVQEGNRI